MYPGFGLPPSLTSSCVALPLPYYSTATLTLLFLNYIKLVPIVGSSRWLFPLPLPDPHKIPCHSDLSQLNCIS